MGTRARAESPPVSAFPTAADASWNCYRTDGAVHATYWIAGWPRIDVGASFLAPLLMHAQMVRTVAVTIEPVPPSRAIREVEAARTADVADDELRRRLGFLPTARRRKLVESAVRREQELADGHAAIRFAGYVTVSARRRSPSRALASSRSSTPPRWRVSSCCGSTASRTRPSRTRCRSAGGCDDLATTRGQPRPSRHDRPRAGRVPVRRRGRARRSRRLHRPRRLRRIVLLRPVGALRPRADQPERSSPGSSAAPSRASSRRTSGGSMCSAGRRGSSTSRANTSRSPRPSASCRSRFAPAAMCSSTR